MAVVHDLVGIHCVCCELPATREKVDDDGRGLFLCDRCPSPDEIRRRAACVRESWDELDHWCRRHGVSRPVGLIVKNLGAKVREQTAVERRGRCVDGLARLAL